MAKKKDPQVPDPEAEDGSADQPGTDSDWLTQESAEPARDRDRHRRSRVNKTPVEDEDGIAELDIDVDELDAIQNQLGDLSDDAFTGALAESDDIGVPLGREQGRMLVTVEEGGHRALLNLLDFAGDASLNGKHVRRVLEKKFDVKFGVDDEALNKFVAAAAKGERVEGNHVIASSRSAEKGEDGKVECLFLLEDKPEIQPAYLELDAAFHKDTIEEVLEHCPLARLVGPGEAIARLVPPAAGKPGSNVFGEVLQEAGTAAEIKLGPNVTESEEVGTYCSDILGYAYFLRDVLAVVSPVWVSRDSTEAYFVQFRCFGPQPPITMEALQAVMEERKVHYGLQQATLERLCNQPLGEGPEALLLARGELPINGTDTHVEYALDVETKPGVYLADGTIDLKTRNTVITVKADEFLGQLVASTPGRKGLTVTGEEIPAKDGEKRPFKPGRNVTIDETAEGGPKFYAEIEGSVRAKVDSLSVEKILQVEGDIDYGVGNVDTTADVEIGGSVKPGFQIKSAGSVVVAGVVEEGARVQAGGNVVVAGGIIGEKTRIIARGSVETKFIQNSMVLAQGDVIVGAYIYNAHVRSAGSIKVNATAESRILGGEVLSAKGIEAGRLGSKSSDRTLVGIRGTPGAEAGLEEAKKMAKACDTAVVKMLRALGLSKVNLQALRACIARTPANKRQEVAGQIRKLQELVAKRQAAVKKQQELSEQIAQDLAKSTISAAQTFPDVMIQIGEQVLHVADMLANKTFFRGEDGIETR